MTPSELKNIRDQFPILERDVRGKKLVYLDSAATTLKPRVVLDAVNDHYALGAANIHRGVHFLSEEATRLYENTRDKVRAFINAPKRTEIIFTSGTTEGINLVAKSFAATHLKAGDEVILSHMEHHSNIVPWQMLREQIGCVLKVIPITDAGELDMDAFRQLLSPKTKFVSIVHTSNSLGTVNPVAEIIRLAHEHKAWVLVDAAQAVAHTKIDVQALDCDFLVFSGHKIFATSGVGVLYGKAALLESMPPLMGGGDMIRSVTFEKTTYAPLPSRLEAGTPAIGAAIGLGAALDFVQEVGLEKIAAYEQELLAYATQKLLEIPGLRIYGTARHKSAIVSFTVDGIHPHDLGTILDQEGIAIRAGHHCTQPVMTRFGIPATARAAFAVYNTKADVDALVAAIHKAQEIFA